MSDLDDSSGSRTLDSPILAVDAGKSTELGPPSHPDPESTDPYLRRRDVSAEAAAVLRYLPLDPPGRAESLGRLAHYEILSVVGRGAMGVVVRAFDTQWIGSDPIRRWASRTFSGSASRSPPAWRRPIAMA
jgi:hypothetical protein